MMPLICIATASVFLGVTAIALQVLTGPNKDDQALDRRLKTIFARSGSDQP